MNTHSGRITMISEACDSDGQNSKNTNCSPVSIMHQQEYPHQQQQQHFQQQQQQQHHHHHQQQHHFMGDIEHWSGEEGQEVFTPKAGQRKAKRIIPDTEKDDKYWEKRKRNNMAAKRSRENKRLIENDMRHKVSHLEEQNAILRQEIAVIKARYGIPQEQSFLTPEEKAQCVLEVKKAQEAIENRRRKDSEGSGDDITSTSPTVYPRALQQAMDESDSDRQGSADNSNSSPKVNDEMHVSNFSYGPAAYGPFVPSPSWTPASRAGSHFFSGENSGNQSVSPSSRGDTKHPFISSPYEDKNIAYGSYFNGNAVGYPRYDYYMQYTTHGNHIFYNADNDGTHVSASPTDLSTNRNKRREEHNAGAGSSASGTRNLIASKHTSVHSIPSVPGAVCLDDVTAMAFSFGQLQQEHYSRGLTLPTRINPSPNHNLPAKISHSPRGTEDLKILDPELVKQENVALKPQDSH